MVLGKNFKKWGCSFFVVDQQLLIGNKFRPPKSSMGTIFQPGSSKNGTFFAFEAVISAREVPQQHHLSQQHFGGHVA